MDLCSAPEDCQGCGWCLDEEQQRETIAAAHASDASAPGRPLEKWEKSNDE